MLWDRATGRPVANAIVWQDRRTASRCDALRQAGHEALFTRKTGLLLDAYFSGTKLAWLLDNVRRRARARAERGELAFGTIDSWLAWQLSGGRAARDRRDQRLAHAALRHPRARLGRRAARAAATCRAPCFPKWLPRAASIARTTCEGLPAGTPVAGIAGDQQAALFGQACHRPGMAKNTYGTGCFLLMNTGDKPVGIAQPAAHHGRLVARRADLAMRSRAASSSPAPRSSGCATASASSRKRSGDRCARGERSRFRRRVLRARALGAGRAVLGSARARHDRRASRAARRGRTSRGPRSRRSRSRARS